MKEIKNKGTQMLEKDRIYRLSRSDAKNYLQFDDDLIEICFKDEDFAFLRLDLIKKKKTKITYKWEFQIYPRVWIVAVTHDVKKDGTKIYEQFFHTYDGIEKDTNEQCKRISAKRIMEIREKINKNNIE